MAFRVGLANFSKGVLSERLIRRVDVDAYNAGLLQGENIVVLKYGGFTIRPGFRYVDETLDEGEQVFPFQFSNEQAYALAMGQGYMQPLAYGSFLLEDHLALVDATNTNPVLLEIALHGYEVGDRILIPADTVVGMTELNGRVWTVTSVPDDDHVEIDADGAGWGTFVSASGGATNVSPPAAPPTPPVVPPPYEPPPPPPVWNPGHCVADSTLIWLASASGDAGGEWRAARDLKSGDMLWTRHQHTLEWGAFPVRAISFAVEPVWSAVWNGNALRATAAHRIWNDQDWVKWCEVPGAVQTGTSVVALITVEEAHTYISAGILSHNIKDYQPEIETI